MNGAITVPCKAMSSIPKIRITMIIGITQSFLRCFMKIKSSLTMLINMIDSVYL